MKSAAFFIISLFVVLAGCGSDNQEAQQADSELKQSDPQAALSNDDESQTKDPRAEAYRLRAEAILDSSRFLRALEDAEAGLKLDPDNRQLRELRDLAAAHLKLANREASIVENTRYGSPQILAQLRPAPVEELSFGDVTQQKKELRELVEHNPFWQKSTNSQREAYLQDLLDVDDEFMPLVISCEANRLVTDQTIDRNFREQFELDLRVTCGLLRTWSLIMKTDLAKQSIGGRILLSPEQRGSLVHDLFDQGIDVRAMERHACTPGTIFHSDDSIHLHRWIYLDHDDDRTKPWMDMSFAKIRNYHGRFPGPIPLDLGIPVQPAPEQPIRILPSSRSWPPLAHSTRTESAVGTNERVDVAANLTAASQ